MARNNDVAGNGKGRNVNLGDQNCKGVARGGNSGLRHQVAYAFPASKHFPDVGTDVFFSASFGDRGDWFEVSGSSSSKRKLRGFFKIRSRIFNEFFEI